MDVFKEDPSLFYRSIQVIAKSLCYVLKWIVESYRPSLTHEWLQRMQSERHNIQYIFTQNIDSLERCIDCPITYLHGVLRQGHCIRCQYCFAFHLHVDMPSTPLYCNSTTNQGLCVTAHVEVW